MTIPEGARLGRYEIGGLIGQGGMGEVYRAADSRLGRNVAIKVLPTAFAQDPDRLRRFEQEAQAAGALNHPNILVIYDVGTHDGAPYVVSELLEGETLRDRLEAAALTPRKAVEYGLQVAHGLSAAHDKGIVHRDLKPENIFVTRDERLKILDFGLAKLVDPRIDSAASQELPTREIQTNPGSVMGTVGYMSPEQVRGQAVDHRTDIFSLGAVLYEMLSGRRAFRGDSAADAVSAILKEDPPELSAPQHQIPLALERVVRRCLEKNREQRFQSASDLAFALEALSAVGSGSTTIAVAPAQTRPASSPRLTRLGWMAAGLILAGAVGGAALSLRQPVAEPAMRFAVHSPERTDNGPFALSPDGRNIAFTAQAPGGITLLWVRSLDSMTPRQLPGTEGAMFPFWSFDGRFLAFFAGNRIKRIDPAGGAAQEIAEFTGEPRGGAWGPDGTILFAPGYSTPLYRVPASGGTAPTAATTLDTSKEQTSHRWPVFLPDGRRFLFFTRSRQSGAEGIYVGSLDSPDQQFLLESSLFATFAPERPGASRGHLLFMKNDSLVAQRFDAARVELSGEPFAIADGILNYPRQYGPTGYAAFSVSNDGHLAFLQGTQNLTRLGWFDRNGNLLEAVLPPGEYHEPALSPDGKRVALGREDTEDSGDIYVLDLGRSTLTRFTFDPSLDVCPVWSPDGSEVIFSSSRERGGVQKLHKKISTGAGPDELLLKPDFNAFANDWMRTKDGSFVLFEVEHGSTRFDLHVLPLSGDRKPIPVLNSAFNETHAQFSPDGRWIAYSSDETGRSEVYVQSFPPTGGKWQISTSGGDQAQWRRDGRELFYITPDRKLVAVPISPGNTFDPGLAVTLFQTRVPAMTLTDDRNNYVPSADGKRFLMNYLEHSAESQPVTLVLNWMASR
jgi:Tol biopolymer transport system component